MELGQTNDKLFKGNFQNGSLKTQLLRDIPGTLKILPITFLLSDFRLSIGNQGIDKKFVDWIGL